MDLTWSLETVARTSDDEVVRRRFDRRNLFWLTIVLAVFLLVAFLELVANRRQNLPFDVVIAALNFAVTAFGLYFLRGSWREAREPGPADTVVGRWLRLHVSATVIVYATLQYVLLLAFNRSGENWVPWGTTFPFFLLGFRMLVSELVLMHALIATTGFAMAIFSSRTPTNAAGVIVGILALNLFALSIELFASRRWRRAITREWSERRAQAREQMRMRDELRYARELQLSMLPECAPRLGWIDICSISVPATEVGGDYYDYFVDDERVALVCGDVAGHGMASGLVLAGLRSGFTLLRDSLHDPARVLQRLHDLVGQTTRRRMLVTVAVALVDRERRLLTVTSAGHPPLILRRSGGAVETVDLWAPPLGVKLPLEIPQRTLALQEGDTIVLHSDGVYETRNARDEIYGLERLEQVVRTAGAITAEQLRDAILHDLDTFRENAPQHDDVTLVVARLL